MFTAKIPLQLSVSLNSFGFSSQHPKRAPSKEDTPLLRTIVSRNWPGRDSASRKGKKSPIFKIGHRLEMTRSPST